MIVKTTENEKDLIHKLNAKNISHFWIRLRAFCRGPPKFQMDEDYTSTFELEIEIVGCVQVT